MRLVKKKLTLGENESEVLQKTHTVTLKVYKNVSPHYNKKILYIPRDFHLLPFNNKSNKIE